MRKSNLTYQPFFGNNAKTVTKSDDSAEDVLNAPDTELPFKVEPVKLWYPTVAFDWTKKKPSNYVEKSDNNISTGNGKVYSSAERDRFKTDLFNAYVDSLQNKEFNINGEKRRLSEGEIVEFAKRFTAQDALESRYGQSGLSRYYNFGGIKDFRENADSLKVDTKEFINGQMKVKKQPFRKFNDLEEYVNYKIDLLGNSNYDVFSYTPNMMYSRLTSAKKRYATDPDYERKLNSIYYLLWRR